MPSKDLRRRVLTEAELAVMNILWDNGEAMTSAQIREASKACGIDNYLFKVLSRLLEKGHVREVGKVANPNGAARPLRLFLPSFTREDSHAAYFDFVCGNNISNLLSGLIQSSEQSEKLVEEIKDWIDQYEKSGEETQ